MRKIEGCLLDTHIFIWLMLDQLDPKNKAIIQKTIEQDQTLYISAISIWEIGMLSAKKRILLSMPVLEWVERALSAPYVQLLPLIPEIAIESCQMPFEVNGDPADRIIIATSRVHQIPLITKDENILKLNDYIKMAC